MSHSSEQSDSVSLRLQRTLLDHPAARWVAGIGGTVWAVVTGMANTSRVHYQSLKWQEPLKTARGLRDSEAATIYKKYMNIAEDFSSLDTLTKVSEYLKKNTARVLNPAMNEELKRLDKTYEGIVDSLYQASGIPTKGALAPFKATAVEFSRLKRHERNSVIFSTITSVMIPFMGLALLIVGARTKKNAQWQESVNAHQDRNLNELRREIEARENTVHAAQKAAPESTFREREAERSLSATIER